MVTSTVPLVTTTEVSSPAATGLTVSTLPAMVAVAWAEAGAVLIVSVPADEPTGIEAMVTVLPAARSSATDRVSAAGVATSELAS